VPGETSGGLRIGNSYDVEKIVGVKGMMPLSPVPFFKNQSISFSKTVVSINMRTGLDVGRQRKDGIRILGVVKNVGACHCDRL
jgi:hypothetical protein